MPSATGRHIDSYPILPVAAGIKIDQRGNTSPNSAPKITPAPMFLAPEVQSFFYYGYSNPGGKKWCPPDALEGKNKTPEEMELQVPPENQHYENTCFLIRF
ncbi:MAG: hypothetical protein KKA54_19230 [Proteobacteria bacterium]|nr:hypothetical protein [Pseudomonadota bacterium]MBU0968504.1 hypothetical protein [Pseudomonadota bacterium]